MRYIENKNKRINAKLGVEAFNLAGIVETKIPNLKVYNKVLTKTEEKEKVWVTGEDLKEYLINPKKVSRRLKLKDEGYKYKRKDNTFKCNTNFTFKVDYNKSVKEIATFIKEKIISKFENLKTQNFKYLIYTSYENENTFIDYDEEEYKIEEEKSKLTDYKIYMFMAIKKEEENTKTWYTNFSKNIHIYVKKRLDMKVDKVKVDLNVTLNDNLLIEINVNL